MTWLRVLGKLFISVGCGVLLFVGWVLWGTGFYTSQQQTRLTHEYSRLAAARGSGEGAPSRTGPPGPPRGFLPASGDPVFRLSIPKIDLDVVVVEGVGQQDLELGPGHYPDCRAEVTDGLCTDWPEVWPGEKGRLVVSGHRTTYLHPFLELDRLKAGDRIDVRTLWGEFSYRVTHQRVVLPGARSIVAQRSRPELVLTTCNPPYSAATRLVVFARPTGA